MPAKGCRACCGVKPCCTMRRAGQRRRVNESRKILTFRIRYEPNKKAEHVLSATFDGLMQNAYESCACADCEEKYLIKAMERSQVQAELLRLSNN